MNIQKRFNSILLCAVSLLLITFLIGIACTKNIKKQTEEAPTPPHSIRLLAYDNYISLYEIDGCQYIICSNHGIIHKANCPNHVTGDSK